MEVNAIPSVVKLHGSLADGLEHTLILTDDQYRLWYNQGEKEYFQEFLRSHLATQRIVFIGYSLNDPEILHIQKRLAANLRRKTPAIAILANVSDIELDRWNRDYNIAVIRYTAKGDDHSELTQILNTAARFVGDSPRISPVTPEQSRLAQKFYLWHKFEYRGETKTRIDALKSVVLSTAREMNEESFTCAQVAEALKDIIKTEKERLVDQIARCCEALTKEGWLIPNKEAFALTPSAKELIDNYNRQYTDLIGTFIKQVELDLSARIKGLSKELKEKASNAVLETLTDVFEIRGIEVVSLAFSKTPVQITGANDVLSTIWNKASRIGDVNVTFVITNYVVDLLTKPQGVAEQVVDYLSKAFFSMQALRVNAGDEELINEFYRNQAFLVDENVLIPLIAVEEPRHELCVNTIKAAIEKGVFLYTTADAAYEVFKHGNWANDLIAQYGEQSPEVLRAAKGEGEYTSNAFLDGYIRESGNHPVVYDFNDYLSQCVEGAFSEKQIWHMLALMGIKRLPGKRIRDLNDNTTKLHKEIQLFIAAEVAQHQGDKSSGRIEREADAYTIIYYWEDFSKILREEHRPQCSFLTFATSLAGVAQKGPRIMKRSVLASPQALYELIIRYLGQTGKEVNIGSVLRSSYFRTVAQFIDKEKYTNFFAPLITASHKTYYEHYELYRTYIEEKLTKGIIDEYDVLDRVDFVSSLEHRLESIPRNVATVHQQMRDEIDLLKKKIKVMEDKERKRKEYVEKQRRMAKETKGKRKPKKGK